MPCPRQLTKEFNWSIVVFRSVCDGRARAWWQQQEQQEPTMANGKLLKPQTHPQWHTSFKVGPRLLTLPVQSDQLGTKLSSAQDVWGISFTPASVSTVCFNQSLLSHFSLAVQSCVFLAAVRGCRVSTATSWTLRVGDWWCPFPVVHERLTSLCAWLLGLAWWEYFPGCALPYTMYCVDLRCVGVWKGWTHLIGLTLTFLISDPSQPGASECENLCGRVAISFFSVKTVHMTVHHLAFAFFCVCAQVFAPLCAGDGGRCLWMFFTFCSDVWSPTKLVTHSSAVLACRWSPGLSRCLPRDGITCVHYCAQGGGHWGHKLTSSYLFSRHFIDWTIFPTFH